MKKIILSLLLSCCAALGASIQQTGFTTNTTAAVSVVGGSTNYETNGLNLIAAYTAAKLKTPHGFALNSTNHYTILLLPGKYRVTGGALVLDAEFIDLVGISANSGSRFYDAAVGVDFGDTVIESSGDTITSSAPSDSDYTLQNLAVVTTTAGNRAFQTTDNVRRKERIINVLFYNTSGIANQSMAENVHYEGTYVDVRAWNAGSFGYRSSGADINASGLFERCKAGDFSFGVSLADTHGTASGTFIDCEADGVSFGRLIASGIFLRCRYVATVGTAGVMFAANTTRSGTFIDCLDNTGIWFSDTASGSSLQLVDPWMTNFARFQEITDPATPSTNNLVLYAKDNGSAAAGLYYKRDDGTVVGPLGAGSFSVTNLTFPATQTASTNVNTLDDYEEGFWTPSDASGASLALTVTASDCIYTKIGRQVIASFGVTYPATADGTIAGIGSLPFTSEAAAASQGGMISYTDVGFAPTFLISPNTLNFNFYKNTGGIVMNSEMSGKIIRGTLIYQASQ